MLAGLISVITGILTGKAGERIGGTVARFAELGALLAAAAPVALWLDANKDETVITVTYGELAFWGSLCGSFFFLALRLVHRAPPP